MGDENAKPTSGETVILTEVPPGMLDDLPAEDQEAITEIVGKPVLLVEYDEDGRAELEFQDRNGNFHFIYVSPEFIGKTV
jgi:hypothetical protein